MAANMKDPRTFFSVGTPAQYDYVFNLYEEALKLKAQQKNKKVADFLKLDKWFQVELPKRIKSRGRDTHLVHEELVQCMKWKLARGKFSPRIKDLVQMNTPRLCITETKKAFRALLKKKDLSSAIQALCNLKGVGPAMASVILTAADDEACAFMADECLLAIPQIEGIDYTTKELLNFVDQLKAASVRLNSSGGSGWNPHKVEQVLWAHSILNDTKKELLDGMPLDTVEMPRPVASAPTENGTASDNTNTDGADAESSSDSVDSSKVTSNINGTSQAPRPAEEEDSCNTNDSVPSSTTTGDRQQHVSALGPAGHQDDTNDSIATSECTDSPVPPHEEDSVNTASPPQQVSEDTNDSIPQQSNQQTPAATTTTPATAITALSNGSSVAETAAIITAAGTVSTTTTTAAVAAATAVSSMDEDTNDSLAMSESTCDSMPEVSSAACNSSNGNKIASDAVSVAAVDTTTLDLSKEVVDSVEPAAKKAKLDE